MQPENNQLKNKSNRSPIRGIATKILLLVLSFLQLHWMPITFAAGTIVTAAMFGDKAYQANISKKGKEPQINIVKEAEKLIGEKKPHEAVKLIEAEIAKYIKLRQMNPDNVSIVNPQFVYFYLYLAKAKEAAGFDKNEVIDAYKDALVSPSYCVEALVWLYKNTSFFEYQDALKKVAEYQHNIRNIVHQMDKINDWAFFESFLNMVFEQVQDPILTAKTIGFTLNGKWLGVQKGIESNGKWNDRFVEYCRSKPKLIGYAIEKDCIQSETFFRVDKFKQAASAYRDILERYKTSIGDKKADIEFEICRCLFREGDYNTAVFELNGIIERNKENRVLLAKVFFLRGQCYIQLQDIDKASNDFLTITTKYPECEQAIEANFINGYFSMLQGKFAKAKEAFNLVVKDYPQSSFAAKAKLCLARIEIMAEK